MLNKNKSKKTMMILVLFLNRILTNRNLTNQSSEVILDQMTSFPLKT